MIAKLTGRLDAVGEGFVILDVGGVGYRLQCSSRTLGELPGIGADIVLHVETQLREDSLTLYGFLDETERDWFPLLQNVQGVGARVALGLLSILSPSALAQAILTEDKAALAQATSVGPKLAQRIVSELKDKVGKLAGRPGLRVVAGGPAPPAGPAADAVSALVNLGYRTPEAQSAVALAARELGRSASLEALIREGLKGLSR